ncbi:MAG: CehA/McbA family metallohydrolase [Myxococcales bacterium]|nr:CehA/McbA family metallohydrolase [Myxococcales bacterium]
MWRWLLALTLLLGGCDDDGDAAPPLDAALDLDSTAGPDRDAPDADPDADPAEADADPADADPDAAPDARVPVVPAEPPTAGEPDLPGADDLTAPVPAGRARAGRVDQDPERIRGRQAQCRVGDLRLDNSRVAVCIQAEKSYGQFTFAGGNIIDAVPADRLDADEFGEAIHTAGLGEIAVERIGIVRDGSDGGPAIIRTEGTAGGALIIQGVLPGSLVPAPIRVTTEFRLAPDSDAVEVLTWLWGIETRTSLRLVDLVAFGDQTRKFPLAVTLADRPALLAAEADGVSYGWVGEAPFEIFPLAVLDLPVVSTQSPSFVLRDGDGYLVRRWLRIGTGDVESVRTPPPDAVEITLRGPPGLRVAFTDAIGAVVTRAQVGPDGTRVVRLSPGDYTATTGQWPGGDIQEPFTAAPGAALALDPPAPATLRVRVVDPDGQGLAGRVDLTSGVGFRREFVVDDRTLTLQAGDWQITTTRGWHYTVDEQQVTLAPGEAAEITAVLEEVIPLEGHAAGEFHQHASPSLDSEVPHLDRVLANMAEGVAFMVPSDHDVIYDYRGLVEREGLTDRIAVPLPGEEISPTFTHIGAYGLPYDPYAGAGGAVPIPINDGGRWRIRTVPELIAEARRRGARIIQINHGREDAGYFNHTGFDPETPIAELREDRFTADFDSMEINNRSSDFCRLLGDWMGLLNQGLRPTAVGNSDTHDTGTAPGYPRNYLPTLAADPVDITADEIVAAITAGDVTVGGGAVIDFPDGLRPGAELQHDADTFTARVRVRTPPYAAVDRLLVFVNGRVVIDRPIESDVTDITDLDAAIDVPVPQDAHVVFLALGDESLAHVRPGRQVFALANPIWIDRDGGGVTPAGPGPVDLLVLPACN